MTVHQIIWFDIFLLLANFFPHKLEHRVYSWIFQSYSRAVIFTKVTVIEKYVNFINHQNSGVILYLVCSFIYLDKISSKYVSYTLQDSFGRLKKHALHGLLKIAASRVKDIFAKLMKSAIFYLVLYVQFREKNIEAFLVSSAQVGRIAGTSHFIADKSQITWKASQDNRFSLASSNLGQAIT